MFTIRNKLKDVILRKHLCAGCIRLVKQIIRKLMVRGGKAFTGPVPGTNGREARARRRKSEGPAERAGTPGRRIGTDPVR